MSVLAAVCASLPLVLLAAPTAPGCGCEVSHCCSASNASIGGSLAELFSRDLTGARTVALTMNSSGYSPFCGFLNLVPGSSSCAAESGRNATVCQAIAADAEAADRLQAGPTILSVFVEPGACADARADACWESGEGQGGGIYSDYTWHSWSTGSRDGWCSKQVIPVAPALIWSVACPRDGGLSLSAKWVDGNSTDTSEPCAATWAGGLRADNLTAGDWQGGADGAPRWQCFDVPREQMGTSDARILLYSVGDLPCVAAGGGQDGGSEPPVSRGARGAVAGAAFAAAAAAFWELAAR